MAHHVKISYPIKDVGKEPFTFTVYRKAPRGRESIYGRLEVRKASIYWYPSGEKKPLIWTWASLNKSIKKDPRKR